MFTSVPQVVLWLMIACLISAQGKPSSADITWVHDYDAAMVEATNKDRLLLAVYLPADFRGTAPPSRESQIYHAVALNDHRVAMKMRSRFVATYREVGPPAELDRDALTTTKMEVAPKSDAITVTYFCTPNGRVMHMLIGYVSADEWLAAAEFAETIYQQIRNQPPREQMVTVRKLHLERVLAENWMLFRSQADPLWSNNEQQRRADQKSIRTVLTAAQRVRSQRLLERFGSNWAFEQPEFLTAMAAHANVEADSAHLALSELPLIQLSEIEEPAYEILTGQQYLRHSPRRERIVDWFNERRDNTKPFMFVINDNLDDFLLAERNLEVSTWEPKSSIVRETLPMFEVLEIDTIELAALLVDARLRPLPLSASDPIRFVILDTSGNYVAHVTQKDSVAKLGRLLQKATRTSKPESLTEAVPRSSAKGE